MQRSTGLDRMTQHQEPTAGLANSAVPGKRRAGVGLLAPSKCGGARVAGFGVLTGPHRGEAAAASAMRMAPNYGIAAMRCRSHAASRGTTLVPHSAGLRLRVADWNIRHCRTAPFGLHWPCAVVGPGGRFLHGSLIDMDGGATKSL